MLNVPDNVLSLFIPTALSIHETSFAISTISLCRIIYLIIIFYLSSANCFFLSLDNLCAGIRAIMMNTTKAHYGGRWA